MRIERRAENIVPATHNFGEMLRLVDAVRAWYAVVDLVDTDNVRFDLFQEIADRRVGPVRGGEVLRIVSERRHIVGDQADDAFSLAVAGCFRSVVVFAAGCIQAKPGGACEECQFLDCSHTKEKGCAVLATPYDTYAAARLISTAAPVRHFMRTKELLKFSVNTPIEDAKKVMASVRHRYFPILDENGKYCGVVSRRNLLNLHRKQVILVDHNERTQAVDGLEQADILEIIDHHRIGSLETDGPVYFRNQPVGCTATIITQMYDENGVEIEPKIAGLLLAAILSDTLVFRSPTCTAVDVNAANRLAGIAGVDIDEFANEMFEAGEKLDGKTAEEVFLQDFKVFMCGDIRFGVAQGSYMTRKNLLAAENLLRPYLEEARNKQNVEDIYMLLTDVPKEESVVISDGRYAAEVLADGFDTHPAEDGSWTLPGVVSRKKQFIPALMTAYQEL